ncbi:MAG: endonuclease III [Candidatus Omnitrophica bacterium]|nr:endonuclease III [Candidatus Omnitrophota bacterium]
MNKALRIIQLIEKQAKKYGLPLLEEDYRKDTPFKILIACILSLRTKDAVTDKVSKRLFRAADTPGKMVKLTEKRIERLIYPAGFYRNKAKTIKGISRDIISKFSGKVPREIEQLLLLNGVGRKTANLVLGLGYNIPSICVDTHVHRICNRLGLVKTKNPAETEFALYKLIPKQYWIKLNSILVVFGQNICVPVSPFCSKCNAYNNCKRIGVKKHR